MRFHDYIGGLCIKSAWIAVHDAFLAIYPVDDVFHYSAICVRALPINGFLNHYLRVWWYHLT